jgi:hypothetical protein
MKSSSIRFRAETPKILKTKIQRTYKNLHGRLGKLKAGCAVITPDQKSRKTLKPQNTVYSAEQEAIIKAKYVTQRKN